MGQYAWKMEPIEITDERGLTRCVIDQARGASIVRWETSAGMPIVSRNVAGEDERAKPGCFIMSPWTNRVARARMSFRGREYALDKRVAADGTAMHGDVRSHPWTIVDRSPVSARLTFESRSIAGGANFPWAFGAEVRYESVRSVLRIDLTLRNRADEPMPCGMGLHPYFPRTPMSGSARQPRVMFPCRGRYESRAMLPVGPARRDGLTRRFASPGFWPASAIDDVFDGYEGLATIDYGTHGVVMQSSAELSHLVAFSPTDAKGNLEPYFAIEPVTMANDAFNLAARGWRGTGVRTIDPGQSLSCWTTLALEM